MARKIPVGIIQMQCGENVQVNFEKAKSFTKEAAEKGAKLVVLPELFQSLYFCDAENYSAFELAEPIPGPSTEVLCELAALYKVVIVASLFEKRSEGIYHNTVAVIDSDGKYLGKYRKMHIPDDPGYYEKFYFTPGDLGYKVFKTAIGNIGTLICWDQWFPEAARLTAMMGADLLVYPTAIGWALQQDEVTNTEQYNAWQIIQRAHAVANGVHVIAVNRTGTEGNMRFWGGSFVSNPFGSIVCQMPHDQEIVHVQEIDLSLTSYYRTHWPFFRDRRIDSYQGIMARFLNEE